MSAEDHSTEYCQYVGGPCAHPPDDSGEGTFFIYPSEPAEIANAIEASVSKLRVQRPGANPRTWRHLDIPGQIVFCEVCQAIHSASTIVADVTTLNFNVLFEIGFAIGLGVPTIPVRDTHYGTDAKWFTELGMLDTLGYLDFSNSDGLLAQLIERLPGVSLPPLDGAIEGDSPVYVLKDPVNPEGAVALLSAVKKSNLRFRAFDPKETARLSLSEARRHVDKSLGVIVHLLGSERGAVGKVHDGRCAIVCGMAMAQGKVVAMFDGSSSLGPVDYRDVLIQYGKPSQIKDRLEQPVGAIVKAMQDKTRARVGPVPTNLLKKVDLGDIAAENEISGLQDYFVPTGQSSQAKRGHARLVVGRKGSGKTALFYDVRRSVSPKPGRIVLDLMPEGHQFTRLREVVLERLTPGGQEQAMVAFWNHVLLVELARQVIRVDSISAYRDANVLSRYERLRQLCDGLEGGVNEDFSRRLLTLVERLQATGEAVEDGSLDKALTQFLYSNDIRELSNALADYVGGEKESIWLLVDNLDKGWPTKGTDSTDIAVVRGFLEATRGLQRELDRRGVDFKCLVFLRTDIYEHLRSETADKGKDTPIRLDQFDRAIFEEIARSRIEASTGVLGTFAELWRQIAVTHVGSEDSFAYIVDRTLMRPRDLLLFLQACVETALNRGHALVTAEDILQAEKLYSEETLYQTASELESTHPDYASALLEFQGAKRVLSYAEVTELLVGVGIDENAVKEAIDLLVWFGFLGVSGQGFAEEQYSHTARFDMHRLMNPVERGRGSLVIHPAFHSALEVRD